MVVDLEASMLRLDSIVNLIIPKPGLPFPLVTSSLTTNRLSRVEDTAFCPLCTSVYGMSVFWGYYLFITHACEIYHHSVDMVSTCLE